MRRARWRDERRGIEEDEVWEREREREEGGVSDLVVGEGSERGCGGLEDSAGREGALAVVVVGEEDRRSVRREEERLEEVQGCIQVIRDALVPRPRANNASHVP